MREYMYRNRIRITTYTLFIILLILVSISTSIRGYAQPYSPPSTKWHTITWVSGNNTWIIDVVAYSNMPWSIGSVAELHVKLELKYSSTKEPLHIIVKVYRGEEELGSQYIGSLSVENNRVEKTFYIYLPYMEYANISAGELVPDNIRIEVEGYTGNHTFTDSFDYPITLYLSPSIIRAELYINSHPYYYALEESLEKTNISVKLYNMGPSNASSIKIELYIDNELQSQQWLEKLGVGEEKTVSFTLFTYIKSGIHVVRAIISYRLPDGTQLVSSAQGLIEAYPPTNIVFEADKTIVLEGSTIRFYGRVTPANNTRIVFLEMLVGDTWQVVNTTTTNSQGSFNFTWRAPSIPIYEDFKQYLFRVRVPVSSVNENISITSNNIMITVYSEKRVVDLIADISLSLTPARVFVDQAVNVNVSLKPALPVCIPVKILYYDEDVMQWVLLDKLEACNGFGNKTIRVNLDPGKYMVKARVSSSYRNIDSGARILEVLPVPSIIIEVPENILAGKAFNITVSLKPSTKETLTGEVIIYSNNTTVYTSKIELVNSTATISVEGLKEGLYTITTTVYLDGQEINSSKTIRVVKPSLTIQPKEQTVEVGSQTEYTITVSPPITGELTVSILKDNKLINKTVVDVNENGVGVLRLKAPQEPGKYTVLVMSREFNMNATAVLNVIEVVRGLKLVLLNKTVEPGGKVYAQVNVTPLPSQALQVHILLNISGKWTPVAFGVIDTSGSTTLTFTAPDEKGEYQVKAELPGTSIESNIETLIVGETPTTRTLLPREAMYGVVAAAVIIGASLYMVGRRRRI